eukprot:g26939.t1
MLGPEEGEDPGVLPRTVELIFKEVEQLKKNGWEFEVSAGLAEVYNDSVVELGTAKGSVEPEMGDDWTSRRMGRCGELCRRVRASAEQLRARQGTCGSSRPLQLQSPPSSLEELMVVFPVVRRARGAERQYVQRSASALKRELSFVTEVLVVGDAGDATATSLHTLGARIGTRARYQERAKHPELRDPSVLRQDFGDPLEQLGSKSSRCRGNVSHVSVGERGW